MKSTIVASIFALSMLMMGGCSSMRDKSAMVQPQDVDDAAYIAQVEQTARSRGVSVRWVNPPQKHIGDDL
jgi:hypothetical protein